MVVDSSIQHKKTGYKSSHSLNVQSLCQLQLEQLTIQNPIFFARIVYYDPLMKTHEEVINYAPTRLPFSQNTLAYLRSEEWLLDFFPGFTLNEIKLNYSVGNCYICPLGYRNQRPEYIQILSDESLSPTLQNYVKQSAVLVSNYLEIYLECGQQKAEIKLLEEIIQRAGHQLRNNLGLIGLYAQNLSLGLKDSPLQEQATILCESIEELDNNLTELIYCGQGAKLRVSLQDLRTLVLESIKDLQILINQKHLQVSLPESSTMLVIDCSQMKQVFDNLLSNAVYFSPEGGTITCNWQVFQSEVLIKISDQGSGLSQEDLQKIFTPFYSRRSKGTGLGLTIAKKIVLDHQGSLWGQNLPNGGAQFSLILPRSKS
ncbi:HAMP domain-containing histidine kinase [Nostoc sp. XA010]|uniref:sensor histidine kinase n=1 Tax=Nostoc sp. XA010 TaxID=2780407 RepID=UPI001E469052|nr:HAMP domain-containing sensor histidine kinase [Nostoc sp. XA010]MCC5659019.1 HAMP domain-containing histidine kinase [Nostoc sp. XA010]